jgi:pimeloyl-ACP methyl ester carboxylesterase
VRPRRGRRWWLTRIGIGALVVLVLLLAAVYVCASVKDARAYATALPEGSLLIDVGGRKIHMRAMGLKHKGPAVVLISGFANGVTPDSAWWAAVQPELAKSMRVYTFDYAGYAWSDFNPEGVSHTNTADDLHAALVALGEEDVILVGFATASNTTIVYHHRYPDAPRLRGIVWLDADVLHPEIVDWYRIDIGIGPAVLHALVDLGFGRLLYEKGWPSQSEQWAMGERLSERARQIFDWDYYNRVAAMRGTKREMHALVDHFLTYSADLDYAASLPLPTDVPLFVVRTDMLRLQSEKDPERAEVNAWRGPYMIEWYHAAAENTPGGRYVFIPDSEHVAMLDQPDALIAAIRGIVELVSDTEASEPAPVQTDVPRFEPSDCPIAIPAGAAVECGYLIVPEDRSNPDSRTIRLGVATLKSSSGDPAPDPVTFITGGPGESAFESIGWLLSTPFLDNRDIIVLEQRGTRYAQPWLDCPELDGALLESFSVTLGEEEIAREVEAAAQCRDRLIDEGVNLAAYNSAASAADLADLRHVLGYEAWNLYGISYGTRLALTVMRDHPEGVRSAILDSTYPPLVDDYVEQMPNAMRSFNVLFAACAADPECHAAYPDLEQAFYRLTERMNANPIPLSVHVPPYNLLATGDDLAMGLYQALYNADMIPFVPFLIYQLHDGNSDVLIPLADYGLPVMTAFSRGMLYSVQCYDEAPFNDPGEVAAAVGAHPTLGNFLPFRSDLAICAVWEAGESNPIEDEPVRSDIPTLILAGEYDPVTPPHWGELAAETLSHSFFYEFPGLGHSVTNDSLCALSMAAAFLGSPSVSPDASCMAEMNGPDFVTPDDLYATPAVYRLNTELLGHHSLSHLGVLGFCLLFFSTEILLLPGNLFRLLRRRSNQNRAAWFARGLAAVTAVLNLTFLVGLVVMMRETMSTNWLILAFGLPAKGAPLFLIPLLSAVLTAGLLAFAVLAWRNGYWSTVGRVHYSLLTLAALAFVWFLRCWDLLSFRLI